jgi:hypothetical protein
MMARVLSLVGVPKGKIPALRLEKYNPVQPYLDTVMIIVATQLSENPFCPKYGVKTRRIFIRTYFVVSFQLMINTNDIKTRGSWVACGSEVFYTLLSPI